MTRFISSSLQKFVFLGSTLALQLLFGCRETQPTAQLSPWQVKGRFLTDPCGDTLILKGMNKMSVFDEADPYGAVYFPEIAKTGANNVRIVWRTAYDTGKPSRIGHLDTLIRNCLQQQMLPIVELHDATCDLSVLPTVLSYWVRPEVVQLVKKYESKLIVNIANEAGDDNTTATQFTTAYQNAITQLRNAGIRTPLMIDAPACGKNLELMVPTVPGLLAHDPQHNLLFSFHPYWPKQFGATPAFITGQFNAAVAANVPLVLGELCAVGAWPGPNASETQSCGPLGAVDYQTLLQQCNQHQIGFLVWEWGPGNGFYGLQDANGNPLPPVLCPAMDATTNGTYASLLNTPANAPNAWIKEVVITSPIGIQKTSKKTQFMLNDFRCQ